MAFDENGLYFLTAKGNTLSALRKLRFGVPRKRGRKEGIK